MRSSVAWVLKVFPSSGRPFPNPTDWGNHSTNNNFNMDRGFVVVVRRCLLFAEIEQSDVWVIVEIRLLGAISA